ncbi:MAG: hypothetical protein OXT72_10705 [Gammaproteobacteria bacterium]|nr:hypothetical protein [Gammaproteobacteria bacterium]MDE0248935.1 hypothetical protein [Gammaproteobacteria bacterium]
MLDLDTYEVGLQADVLTNIPGIHALTAWRGYNAGAVVEHRLEELGQLSAGKTTVNDLGGNVLPWDLSVVTCESCAGPSSPAHGARHKPSGSGSG